MIIDSAQYVAGPAPMSGIEDRAGRNEQTISGTLERLVAALEA